MPQRRASISRETGETRVSIELSLDGKGSYEIATGLGMLDHFVAQLARHGLFDITAQASGDGTRDHHHVVEDVAIALGRAFREAVGEGKGIVRMGSAAVPMDEALALVAVDLSGRGYAVVEAGFGYEFIGDLQADLVRHFMESLAMEGHFNLHARILAGSNDHHKAEALFKALARALDQATRLDPRRRGQVPSTKGVL